MFSVFALLGRLSLYNCGYPGSDCLAAILSPHAFRSTDHDRYALYYIFLTHVHGESNLDMHDDRALRRDPEGKKFLVLSGPRTRWLGTPTDIRRRFEIALSSASFQRRKDWIRGNWRKPQIPLEPPCRILLPCKLTVLPW